MTVETNDRVITYCNNTGKKSGQILETEWMPLLPITKAELSRKLGLSGAIITRIISGRNSITVNTALGLSSIFGNSHHYWLDLRSNDEGYTINPGSYESKKNEKSKVHPGQILETEWMSKEGMSKSELSRRLNVSANLVTCLINGTRNISFELAHKLAQIFGNNYHYWIDLQISYNEGILED
jgi:addiction module HigA family antidote